MGPASPALCVDARRRLSQLFIRIPNITTPNATTKPLNICIVAQKVDVSIAYSATKVSRSTTSSSGDCLALGLVEYSMINFGGYILLDSSDRIIVCRAILLAYRISSNPD